MVHVQLLIKFLVHCILWAPLLHAQIGAEEFAMEVSTMNEVNSDTEVSGMDKAILPSYLCLDAENQLCLGISNENSPMYNPENLYHLQLKARNNNEMKGLDFQKMRWRYDPSDGRIRLANYTTLCLARMAADDPREVVLRPCGSQKNLDVWDVGFSASGSTQVGVVSLRAWPGQCLTVMRCGARSLADRCDASIDEPFTGGSFNSEAHRGAYVKIAPCQVSNPSQAFVQVVNCSPGCSPTMQENGICDPACQNAACEWDNDVCPKITPKPTVTSSPSTSPTHYPSLSPVTSVPTSVPTTAVPSSKPSAVPTTRHPTLSPTLFPTSQAPSRNPTTSPTVAPSRSPTKPPTSRPTQSPSTAPTQLPSASPTTSSPSFAPSNAPTLPTVQPTSSPSASPTERNVTLLAATPLANASNASNIWWAWVLIVLLSLCLCGLFACLYFRYRNRRERELELQARRLQQDHAFKLAGDDFPSSPEYDIEAIGDSPQKSSNRSITETHANTPEAKQQSPKSANLPQGAISQMKSNSPNVIPPEYIEKRRQDDLKEAKEARERRAARRSVMKLLSAMNDLDDAFQVVEKELESDPVMNKEDTIYDDVENHIRLDDADENVNHGNTLVSARKRSNTSSPRKRAPLQPYQASNVEINRIARKEQQELAMEMRSQKIHSAIGKLESAIGSLEQRIVHEKVKSMGKAHRQDQHHIERKSAAPHPLSRPVRKSSSPMKSDNQSTTFHVHDSSMDDDSLNISTDSVVETHRLSRLIVGRSSRGMPLV